MPFKKKNDFNEYMRQYRARQRKLLEQARKQLGMSTKIRTNKIMKKGKKK